MSSQNLIKDFDSDTRLKNFFKNIEQKIKKSTNSKVLYSANFGSYDSLKDPILVEPGIDYIYFTDNPKIKSDLWQVILIDSMLFDSRMMARIFKHLPHFFLSQYKSSIWLDAQIRIDKSSINYIFSLLNNNNFICFKHNRRNRVYMEALACIKIGHESIFKIVSQYISYKLNGFKDHDRLIESGVLARNHMKRNISLFQEAWIKEIFFRSIRDQLSFNYVASKENLEYFIFSEKMSDLFSLSQHKHYGIYKNGSFKIPIQRRIYRIINRFRGSQ